MKKYIMFFFVFVLSLSFFVPLTSFAQSTGDVDPNPPSECANISNNLRYKARDASTNGDVSTLQDFLQSKNYLSADPTGYFGLVTMKAVKSFQKDNGIAPTGYVGPLTRAKIKALTCDATEAGAPVISGVEGPQTLNVNQTGTWKINASDASGGNLWYQVDWGDTGTFTCTSTSACDTSPRVTQQTATFTHSYAKAGTYNPIFYVSNTAAQGAKTSITVSVGNVAQSSIKIISPNGGETCYIGKVCSVNFTYGGNIPNTEDTYLGLYLERNEGVITQFLTTPFSKVNYNNYNWTIPASWSNSNPPVTGNNFLIRATIYNINTGKIIAYDESDLPFSIVPSTTSPSVTVTSPDGGTYKAGDKITVKWNTQNISADTMLAVNVSSDNPVLFGFLTPHGTPNDGSETFTIGADWPKGSNYKFIVGVTKDFSNSNMSVYGTSKPFSVVPTITTTNPPFSIVIANNPKVTYAPGENVNIEFYGKEPDMTYATQSEGFYSQAYMYDSNHTKQYNAANAIFDSSTNKWSVSLPAPSDETKTYSLQIYLYCGIDTSICANKYGIAAQKAIEFNFYVSGHTVTVLSPNGGEGWIKGTTQMIKWNDTNDISTHEIKLSPYVPPCTSRICPMIAVREPYTIANLQGSTFNWTVGKTWEDPSVPTGSYTVEICQTGTSNCDTSDGPFKVTEGTTTTPSVLKPTTTNTEETVSLLKNGSTGPQVSKLQQFLNAAGYLLGKIDGKFGALTEAAVIKYQAATNQPASGVVNLPLSF